MSLLIAPSIAYSYSPAVQNSVNSMYYGSVINNGRDGSIINNESKRNACGGNLELYDIESQIPTTFFGLDIGYNNIICTTHTDGLKSCMKKWTFKKCKCFIVDGCNNIYAYRN